MSCASDDLNDLSHWLCLVWQFSFVYHLLLSPSPPILSSFLIISCPRLRFPLFPELNTFDIRVRERPLSLYRRYKSILRVLSLFFPPITSPTSCPCSSSSVFFLTFYLFFCGCEYCSRTFTRTEYYFCFIFSSGDVLLYNSIFLLQSLYYCAMFYLSRAFLLLILLSYFIILLF